MMDKTTIETLNRYAERTGAKRDIIDILAVDFGVKHGAILDERGVNLREVVEEDYGFSYEYDSEHGIWYVASHPSMLQLVRGSYISKERKQLALGLFCGYDTSSVISYLREDSLDQEQVVGLSENGFQEFLASTPCYYPYSPSPTSLDRMFERAERRYELAKIVEPLFSFDFPEVENKKEVEA